MDAAPGESDPARDRMRGRVAVIVTLVVLSLAMSSVAAMRREVIERDGATFVTLARHAAAGDVASVLAHNQHPLFPLVVGAVGRVSGIEMTVAGRAVCVAAKALALVALFLLIEGALGARAAIGAGVLFIFAPRLVHYSSEVADCPDSAVFVEIMQATDVE